MIQIVKIKSFFIIIILLFAVLLWSYAVTNNNINTKITKIVYHFKDSSVPPQYHRSYTITVTRDQIHIIVDSYGDIISDSTFDMPENEMNNLIKFIGIYQIRKQDYKDENKSCTGGTSKSITVFSGKNILLEGVVYKCGGSVHGSLSGGIDAFTKMIEDLVPDFTKLLQ